MAPALFSLLFPMVLEPIPMRYRWQTLMAMANWILLLKTSAATMSASFWETAMAPSRTRTTFLPGPIRPRSRLRILMVMENLISPWPTMAVAMSACFWAMVMVLSIRRPGIRRALFLTLLLQPILTTTAYLTW